ncbi:MAG: zf-HC2 domain-containing protein, partial [Candidatus Acidiferrum sp.]
MDHTEAVRLQAAEKYLLGELPKAQREEYEEHYFDCPACADELKMTVTFLESTKQVVRQGGSEAIVEKGLVPISAGGWFRWLRPAFAVPVFAVLVAIIGYQSGIVIPNLKQANSRSATAEVVKSFSLMSVGSRGDGSSLVISVGPHEDFGLDVDMPGNSPSGYQCEIRDASGKVHFSLPVSSEEAKRTVHIHVPGGSLQPGKY